MTSLKNIQTMEKSEKHHVHSLEKTQILSHHKNISWNRLFSNFFSENVAFTKFLSKRKFREFNVSLNFFGWNKKISWNQMRRVNINRTVEFEFVVKTIARFQNWFQKLENPNSTSIFWLKYLNNTYPNNGCLPAKSPRSKKSLSIQFSVKHIFFTSIFPIF